MSIDLNGLSARELDALISQAKKRKSTLGKRKPVAVVRKRLAALAKAEGYTLEELFGGGAPRATAAPAKSAAAKTARRTTKGRKLGKVQPKYRNPANPEQTWAGRGQQPKWLSAAIAGGRALEDFLIA